MLNQPLATNQNSATTKDQPTATTVSYLEHLLGREGIKSIEFQTKKEKS